MKDINRRDLLKGAAATAAISGIPTVIGETNRAEAATPDPGTSFSAVTVKSGDIRYPELIRGMNQRWVSHPDYVRLVSDTDQVVQAVQEAVDSGRRISIQGGGHCYTDFVHNPEVKVVINMTEMKGIYFDADRQAFAVEAGATLMEVYEKLFKIWGVTIPGGMCFSVGVGGHVSGGGYGLLSRKLGLVVDHLYAVEVVTVDGAGKARAVVATREENDPNRDLWWAHTGGGGGNFGVVTRYWFRTPSTPDGDPSRMLPNPPETVLVNAVSLPWSDLDQTSFSNLIRNYGNWHENNGAPGSPGTALCSFLLINNQANGSVGLLTFVDATDSGAEKLLQDYLSALLAGVDAQTQPVNHPVGELSALPDLYQPQILPWFTAVRLLGTDNPTLTNPTLRGDYKSAYLKKSFTDEQIAAMYTNLTRSDFQNPQSIMVLLSFGGQINSVASDATAASQRDSVFKVLFETFWSDESDDAANIDWCRTVYREVFAASGGYPVPNAVQDGCYINYPDTDINDPEQNTTGVPWHTFYYKGNYPRLQQIKAAYDPGDVFRHSQSIALPGK